MTAIDSRAHRGMDAIERYAQDDSPQERGETRTQAVDLIADVLHALDRWGYDAEAAHAMAWRHYIAETD
jgi:hypothetical protein